MRGRADDMCDGRDQRAALVRASASAELCGRHQCIVARYSASFFFGGITFNERTDVVESHRLRIHDGTNSFHYSRHGNLRHGPRGACPHILVRSPCAVSTVQERSTACEGEILHLLNALGSLSYSAIVQLGYYAPRLGPGKIVGLRAAVCGIVRSFGIALTC